MKQTGPLHSLTGRRTEEAGNNMAVTVARGCLQPTQSSSGVHWDKDLRTAGLVILNWSDKRGNLTKHEEKDKLVSHVIQTRGKLVKLDEFMH